MKTIFDHLFILFLFALVPVVSTYSYKKIKPYLIANTPGVRSHVYRMAMFQLWLFAGVIVAVWSFSERSFGTLGFGLPLNSSLWIGLSATAVYTGYAAARLYAIRAKPLAREKYFKKISSMPGKELIPASSGELHSFFLLSVTAGICEEVIYRGFFIWYLAQSMHIEIAMLLSSVIFGSHHLYQGVRGVIKTAIIGLVLAILLVSSGSLLVPILLHGAINIFSGLTAWELSKGERVTK